MRFAVPDQCEVLEASIVSMSSPSNNASLKAITANAIVPEFEFLDSNQGFKCEVLHTAPTGLFEIAGTIKGTGQPREADNSSFLTIPLILLQVLLRSVFIISIGIATGLLIALPIPLDYKFVRGLIIAVSLVAFSIAGFVIQDKLDDYFSKRRPPGSLDT